MRYLAENLKALRKGSDFTQEDAAERLGVSPQSVSKWERGETLPDITLLPALANLYRVSVDALIGMDKINDRQTRQKVFSTAHEHLQKGEAEAAVQVYAEALKTFPNDQGLLSDYAMALALCGDPDKLAQAIALCERVLVGGHGGKLHHSTRAALCFMYRKCGEQDKALAAARQLPHLRECRENILVQLEKEANEADINAYLKFIAIGEGRAQDVIEIDFGIPMLSVCTEHGLLGRIESLRKDINERYGCQGYDRLPMVRIRDNTQLAPRQVRVRRYADYLLDGEFDSPALAAEEIIKALRDI